MKQKKQGGSHPVGNRTVVGIICIAVALAICFGIAPLVNKLSDGKTEIVRLSKDVTAGTLITESDIEVVEVGSYNLPMMMDRIIFLGTAIDDDVANIIQAQLLFLESVDSTTDIQIYLNTPGGYVNAGLGIYDTMQYIKPDVATICTGLAASMGSVLLCAGQKGKRTALEHSRVMIHQPLGGAQGQASDIEIAAREILKTKEELYSIIAKHTGKSIKKIEKDGDRDYWLTAKEALDYGIIDEILINKK